MRNAFSPCPVPRAPSRPSLRVERLEDRTVPDAGPVGPVFPTDAGFQSLWGLHNTGQTGGKADADIDAPEAWAVATGGTAAVVAVIDTGIDYTHPDLYLNVWLNQGEIPAGLRPGRLADNSPDPNRLRDTDGDALITFYDLNAEANAAFVSDLNGTRYIDAGDLLRSVTWVNGLSDDGVGHADDLIGWNYVANNNDPYDDNGHGTHVSGTIGATPNAYGVAGVAWRTQLMAQKILGPAGSDTLGEVVRDATAAIRDATDNGARVSNNSWVFYDTGTRRAAGETVAGTKYTDLYAAIRSAGDRGHLVVAAAGNDGYNNDTSAFRNYPASYDLSNIVSVAASDKNDRRASFSNYGTTTVDLAAPGGSGGVVPRPNDNIWSTVPAALDTDGTADGYASYRGTSMAAPHVTGTIALMLSARPDLSAARVKELLLASVDPLTDASWLTSTKVKGGTVTEHRLVSGGRLNAHRALHAALAEPPSGGATGTTASPAGSGTASPLGTGAGASAGVASAGSASTPEAGASHAGRTTTPGVAWVFGPFTAVTPVGVDTPVARPPFAEASDRRFPALLPVAARDDAARDRADALTVPDGGGEYPAGVEGEEWFFGVFVG